MVKRVINFATKGIWEKNEDEYRSNTIRWFVKLGKIMIAMFQGIRDHGLFPRASALTYYTLLSIVPIFALVIGIGRGLFGFDSGVLVNFANDKLPQYASLFEYLKIFAENTLDKTKGGVIAFSGFAVLLWAVIRLLSNLETSLNRIWEVKKGRSITRMFSDYISIVFLAPALLIMVLYQMNRLPDNPVYEVLSSLITLLLTWSLFTLIYMLVPNTKVKLRCAVTAGILAGTAFYIFQDVYFFVQSKTLSLNAIYGGFVAIPLFLIWLHTSWRIVLLGAELSFAFQNIKRFEQEQKSLLISHNDRRKVLISVMVAISKHFVCGEATRNSEEIADELNLPMRVVRGVLFDLERGGLVKLVVSEGDSRINDYVPAKDVHGMTVCDILFSVESRGDAVIDFDKTPEMDRVAAIVDSLQNEALRSGNNVLVSEIIDCL